MNGDTHMEQQPTVSVVVPVYNAQTDLKECLDSISKQTLKNWEAILVDDGSTDGSAAILDAAAKKDPRFRVIHKQNAGVSRARNDGIDAARGKYVMFIDADDLILPTCLSKMVSTAETYGTDLVLSGFDRFGDDWETHNFAGIFPVLLTQRIEDFLMLYTEPRTNMFGVSIWAKLFRTDMLNAHGLRFDPDITYEEDCNFIADCLGHIKTVSAVGEVLYRYRQQEESLSKGYRKNTFRFLVHGYRRRRGLLSEHGMQAYFPKLKDIFYIVIKNTCQKIASSGLSKKERILEYADLIAFPEVQDATDADVIKKTRLTVRINKALKRKDAKQLNRIMAVWRVEDAIVEAQKGVKRLIQNRGRKEKK